MLRAKGGKPLSKELCPRGRSARLLSCLARHGIVRSQAMPLLLIRFSEGESFALLRHHVYDPGTTQCSNELESVTELLEIVSVDRAKVPEPKLLEEHPRGKKILHALF